MDVVLPFRNELPRRDAVSANCDDRHASSEDFELGLLHVTSFYLCFCTVWWCVRVGSRVLLIAFPTSLSEENGGGLCGVDCISATRESIVGLYRCRVGKTAKPSFICIFRRKVTARLCVARPCLGVCVRGATVVCVMLPSIHPSNKTG